jgi:hypothetical protein
MLEQLNDRLLFLGLLLFFALTWGTRQLGQSFQEVTSDSSPASPSSPASSMHSMHSMHSNKGAMHSSMCLCPGAGTYASPHEYGQQKQRIQSCQYPEYMRGVV